MAQPTSETKFEQSLTLGQPEPSEPGLYISSSTTDNQPLVPDRDPIQSQDASRVTSEGQSANNFRLKNIPPESDTMTEINALFNGTLTLDPTGERDERRSVTSSRDDAASRSNASSPASSVMNARSSAPSSRTEPAASAPEPSAAPTANQNNQVDVNQVLRQLLALKDPHILARLSNDDVRTLINEFTSLCKYFEEQLQLRTALAYTTYAANSSHSRSSASGPPSFLAGNARIQQPVADNPHKSYEAEHVARQSFQTPPPQAQQALVVARGFTQAQPVGPRGFTTPQTAQMSTAALMTQQNMQVRHQLAFNTPQPNRGVAGRPNPDAPIFVPGGIPLIGEPQYRMPAGMGPIGSVSAAQLPFNRPQPVMASSAMTSMQPQHQNDPRSLFNASQGRSHEMLLQLFPNASPNAKGETRLNQPPTIVPPGFGGFTTAATGPLSGPEAVGARGGFQPATGASGESGWPADASMQAGFGRSASVNYNAGGFLGGPSAPIAGSLLATGGAAAVAGGAARGIASPQTMMPAAQANASETLITATANIPTSAGATGTPGPPQQFTVSIMAQPTIFRVGGGPNGPRYSRKVFVGGLPPDVDEREIVTAFKRFGPCVVDWPHKTETKSYFPPKGYCFVIFQEESSVHQLIGQCASEEDKLYWVVSSPTSREKLVQIRPWDIADADTILDPTKPLDPRKTVFVGGVPRPLKSRDLALLMNELLSGVVYAGIDTDPELKYPKGAGRVSFDNNNSYINAINSRFVHVKSADMDKRMEVKPYVLDDQMCDECSGANCGGQYAPYFCSNVTCLQYYCEPCWRRIHSLPGRESHRPLIKEGSEHRIEKHTRILQQLITQSNQQPSLAPQAGAAGGAKSLLGERSPFVKPAGGSAGPALHPSASATGRFFAELQSSGGSGGPPMGNDAAHPIGAQAAAALSGGMQHAPFGMFAKQSTLSADSALFPQAPGAASVSPKAPGPAAVERTLDSLFQMYAGPGPTLPPHF